MNRQRLILFVLVILFAVAVIWSYSTMPRLKTADSVPSKPAARQTTRPTAASKTPDRSADDGSRLKLDLLDKEGAGFSGYRRNIFNPVFADETKITRQRAVAIKPPPPKPVPVPVVEPVLIQPESAPLARFTFLGFLKKGATKTIFLAKEKDILLVKKGDKLAGRYEATDISDQALTLTVTDTGDEIVIPLIENRPLSSGK